jgi:Cu/Ag efflux protein CusF
MLRTITIIAALVLAIAFPVAVTTAAEVEGKIQSINTDERTVTLDNGTRLSVPDGPDLGMLKEGAEIKAMYEERDGKNVVTELEMK